MQWLEIADIFHEDNDKDNDNDNNNNNNNLQTFSMRTTTSSTLLSSKADNLLEKKG